LLVTHYTTQQQAEAAALASVDAGWQQRRGVALAIEACAAAHALQGDLSSLFTFLVQEGLADSDALVRAGMLQVTVPLTPTILLLTVIALLRSGMTQYRV
jgi:hypothetical protein